MHWLELLKPSVVPGYTTNNLYRNGVVMVKLDFKSEFPGLLVWVIKVKGLSLFWKSESTISVRLLESRD